MILDVFNMTVHGTIMIIGIDPVEKNFPVLSIKGKEKIHESIEIAVSCIFSSHVMVKFFVQVLILVRKRLLNEIIWVIGHEIAEIEYA